MWKTSYEPTRELLWLKVGVELWILSPKVPIMEYPSFLKYRQKQLLLD